MPKVAPNYRLLSAELDEILLQLESEDLDIDEAVKLYKKGSLIVKDLEKYLKTVENTVKKIKLQFEK